MDRDEGLSGKLRREAGLEPRVTFGPEGTRPYESQEVAMAEWPKVMVEATPVDCTISTLREGLDEDALQQLMLDCGLTPLRRERVVPADLAKELYEALEKIYDWANRNGRYSIKPHLAGDIAHAALARYEKEVGGS
jgi:hypothetical protein